MSDDAPILPHLSLLGAGKDALIAERPTAEPWVERGVYSHLFVGWRAQYAVARKGLASEVRAARLGLAEDDELTEVARSNYDTDRNSGSTFAVGEVLVARSVVHARADENLIAAPDAQGQGSHPFQGNTVALHT